MRTLTAAAVVAALAVLGVALVAAPSDAADGDVEYVYYHYGTGSYENMVLEAGSYQLLTDQTVLDGGHYVVKGTVNIQDRITVTDTVFLYLTDGCQLNAAGGIGFGADCDLLIFGGPANSGKLKVDIDNPDIAAIGEDRDGPGRGIKIHGGIISAYNTSGPGISANIIDIYGGFIDVIGGGNSAGVGSYSGESMHSIKILGGAVQSMVKGLGAGIGAGHGGCVFDITVSNCIVGTLSEDGVGLGFDAGNGPVVIEDAIVTANSIKPGNDHEGTTEIRCSFVNVYDEIWDETDDISGIIFEGYAGIYIPSGSPHVYSFVHVEDDQTLTIPDGTKLEIDCIMTVSGTLINNGTITGTGSIRSDGQIRGHGSFNVPVDEGHTVVSNDGNFSIDQSTADNVISSGSDILLRSAHGDVTIPHYVLDYVDDLGDTIEFSVSVYGGDVQVSEGPDMTGYKGIDVNMYVDGKEVHDLSGRVEINLDLPLDYDGGDVRIHFVDQDGSLEDIPCTVSGSEVTFYTDHFSVFVICDEEDCPHFDDGVDPLVAFAIAGIVSVVTVAIVARRY